MWSTLWILAVSSGAVVPSTSLDQQRLRLSNPTKRYGRKTSHLLIHTFVPPVADDYAQLPIILKWLRLIFTRFNYKRPIKTSSSLLCKEFVNISLPRVYGTLCNISSSICPWSTDLPSIQENQIIRIIAHNIVQNP